MNTSSGEKRIILCRFRRYDRPAQTPLNNPNYHIAYVQVKNITFDFCPNRIRGTIGNPL
jgi:hypothetical protein